MPDRSNATRSLEHEVRIEATPETVFAFFTDPARIVRWLGNDATLDPRPGGVFRVRLVREIGETAISGEFVEVVPHSRVVFTWGFQGGLFGVPPRSTRVEVTLLPDDGATVVRLSHAQLPDEAAEAHTAGWHHYLGRLAAAATGRPPGPDAWLAPGVVPPDGAGEVA